ncbi:hypothetical protein LCGC14_1760270, partial [marine sediment metagenome]
NNSKVPVLFIATSSAEKSYTLDGTDDAGTTISSHIQYGLQPMSGAEPTRILNVETFVERLAGRGTMIVKVATSNALDTAAGTLSSGQTIDLTAVPVKEPKGFDARGRFTTVRFEWDSSDTVRFRGAIAAAQEQI